MTLISTILINQASPYNVQIIGKPYEIVCLIFGMKTILIKIYSERLQ